MNLNIIIVISFSNKSTESLKYFYLIWFNLMKFWVLIYFGNWVQSVWPNGLPLQIKNKNRKKKSAKKRKEKEKEEKIFLQRTQTRSYHMDLSCSSRHPITKISSFLVSGCSSPSKSLFPASNLGQCRRLCGPGGRWGAGEGECWRLWRWRMG